MTTKVDPRTRRANIFIYSLQLILQFPNILDTHSFELLFCNVMFCLYSTENRHHYINDISVEVKKAMSKQDMANKQEQMQQRGQRGTVLGFTQCCFNVGTASKTVGQH